jgi:hypothetical protein
MHRRDEELEGNPKTYPPDPQCIDETKKLEGELSTEASREEQAGQNAGNFGTEEEEANAANSMLSKGKVNSNLVNLVITNSIEGKPKAEDETSLRLRLLSDELMWVDAFCLLN